MTNKTQQKQDLLDLVKHAVEQDQALREQYQVGDKFRFIRDRLHLLLSNMEANLLESRKQEEIKKDDALAEDEILVYVHLFNAQGIVVESWNKLLLPSVFYEYSVNRPIYTEKSNIESFIRSKPNKVQHAYFAVVIKKSSILTSENLKDAVGNPIVKVKEGTLDVKRLVTFTHNHMDYLLSNGKLVKKE